MQISQQNRNPLPTAEFEKLDRTTKMLVFLLGLKAAAIWVSPRTPALAQQARPLKRAGNHAGHLKFCARCVLIAHSRSVAAHSFAIDEPVEGRLLGADIWPDKLSSRENSCCNLRQDD